jgi:hypothetical protein
MKRKRENPRTRATRRLAAYAKRVVSEWRQGWTLTYIFVRTVAVGDRALSITAAQLKLGTWSVTAVVNSASAETAAEVFEAHSHEVIGEKFRTATGAQRAGERYLRAWLKKQKKTKACACKPISPRRPSRRTGARAPRQAARRRRS